MTWAAIKLTFSNISKQNGTKHNWKVLMLPY